MALRMHAMLCTCHFCRDYGRQVVLFRGMCRKLAEEHDPEDIDSTVRLSPEARERITSRIRGS